jgi:diguanylate cyclase (GGDEF)-like protein
MFKEVHVEGIESRAGAPQIAALLAEHRACSAEGRLPPYSDFNPKQLTEHAANLAVVKPLGAGDYLYVHYGRAIFEASGVEMLGSKVSQWKSEVGAFFCAVYDRATSELRPVYTVHRAHHAMRVHLWERLVLPTKGEDGSVWLVVFNKPREYRDDLLREVLDASPDGILSLRCMRRDDGTIEDATVITVNERAAEILGCPVRDLVDRPILQVIPNLKGTSTWARYLQVVHSREPQRFELSLLDKGRPKWFDIKARPLGDGFIVSISDVSQLKGACQQLEAKNARLAEEIDRREQLEAKLRRLADVDGLTGVASRRALMEAGERLQISVGRHAAVVALDVDHFKNINDRYGHTVGDKVLAAVGETLRKSCRPADVVGRIGGEEFAIILPDTSLQEATEIASRLRERLAATAVRLPELGGVAVTASLGVAGFTPAESFASVLARADAGLYEAKRAGRDQVITTPLAGNFDLNAA